MPRLALLVQNKRMKNIDAESLTAQEKRALRVLKLLSSIDKLLDKIDEVDPYGDVVQNFEDGERIRHTKRLMEMIVDDVRSGYWRR